MRDTTFHLAPAVPYWLIAVVAVALAALLIHGVIVLRRREVQPRGIRILTMLRFLVAIVFLLCLMQPVISYTRDLEETPEMLVLVDTSQSMSLPAGEGKPDRLQQVVRDLEKTNLPASLRGNFRVSWFSFDRSAYAIAPGELGSLKAAGKGTRYAASLESALAQITQGIRARSGAPSCVLLVSDGHDHGEKDLADLARERNVTVYALPAGASASSSPSLHIADVQCAPRVLLGSESQFLVALREESRKGATAKLRLLEDGKEAATRDVVLAPGKDEQRVLLSHRPREAGLKKYAIHVDADGVSTGAPFTVTVQVVDSKHEVLVLEDTWRWEFKYLRRVFEDDPSFTFTAFLARGNTFVQFGEGDRRVKLAGFPQGRAELDWFDVMILGDVDPRRWPRGLASSIGQWVEQGGRSLIVHAGPNLGHLARVPELSTLLPVEITSNSGNPVEGPIDITLTPEGRQAPYFFAASAAEQKELANLPALDQVYPAIRKRPAATVLVEAAKRGNEFGPLAVIAEQPVGRGRVLFIASDTIWKWQTLGGSPASKTTPHRRFWQQALRTLAPTRTASGNIQLWLQPERSRYQAGQKAGIVAELVAAQPVVQPKVQAGVVLPDGRKLPLSFDPDPARPNHWRCQFTPVTAGSHRLLASLISEGKTAAEASAVLDVDEAQGELNDRTVDEGNLSRIALATGGRKIDLSNPATWPQAADHPPARVERRRNLDLWNDFVLLITLCLLLGADWLYRVLRGYI